MPHVHAPGLVLRFDPQVLAVHGTTASGSAEMDFSHPLYFVCVDANPKDALWIPLFPGPGVGRKGIAATAKTGHAQWTRHSSFYDPAVLCRVGHKTAQKAAEAARDQSSPKVPNRISVAQLPARSEFPLDAAFRPMLGRNDLG